jgi:Raf kinase inhibitor-like YbhB/YbcL family protein
VATRDGRGLILALALGGLAACSSSATMPAAETEGTGGAAAGGRTGAGGRVGAGGVPADSGSGGAEDAATPEASDAPGADAAAPDAAGVDVPAPDAPAIDTAPDTRAAEPDAPAGTLILASTGFLTRGPDLIFPASASYPMDHSPPFAWTGVPAGTHSLALTFVDTDNGATKWVIWDIPATATGLPGDVSKAVHPAEVPGSSQRGSLGRTGYSGPGVAGPPLHTYEFVVWALDVDKLPDVAAVTTTADIRKTILPRHRLAMSPPLVAKGQLGGP